MTNPHNRSSKRPHPSTSAYADSDDDDADLFVSIFDVKDSSPRSAASTNTLTLNMSSIHAGPSSRGNSSGHSSVSPSKKSNSSSTSSATIVPVTSPNPSLKPPSFSNGHPSFSPVTSRSTKSSSNSTSVPSVPIPIGIEIRKGKNKLVSSAMKRCTDRSAAQVDIAAPYKVASNTSLTRIQGSSSSSGATTTQTRPAGSPIVTNSNNTASTSQINSTGGSNRQFHGAAASSPQVSPVIGQNIKPGQAGFTCHDATRKHNYSCVSSSPKTRDSANASGDSANASSTRQRSYSCVGHSGHIGTASGSQPSHVSPGTIASSPNIFNTLQEKIALQLGKMMKSLEGKALFNSQPSSTGYATGYASSGINAHPSRRSSVYNNGTNNQRRSAISHTNTPSVPSGINASPSRPSSVSNNRASNQRLPAIAHNNTPSVASGITESPSRPSSVHNNGANNQRRSAISHSNTASVASGINASPSRPSSAHNNRAKNQRHPAISHSNTASVASGNNANQSLGSNTVNNKVAKPSMGTWFWEDDTEKLIAFTDPENRVLERAFAKDDGSTQKLTFPGTPHQCSVNFGRLKMIDHRNKELSLIRIVNDISETSNQQPSSRPSTWQAPVKQAQLIIVRPGSAEFIHVEQKLRSSLPKAKVTSIERVENQWLSRKYQMKRTLITEKNGLGKVNGKELFHGTRHTDPKEIWSGEYGFDMRFSADGMWGRGMYFAVDAAYCHNNGYAYVMPSNQACRQVFLAHVLTGDSIKLDPDRNIKTPPKNEVTGFMYDSITGETRGHNIYILYTLEQAFPEYLITYFN